MTLCKPYLTTACLMALTFTGCVDTDPTDGPDLGETSAALSTGRYLQYDDPTADYWLALTSNSTCFLRGVTGEIIGQPQINETPWIFDPALAEVFISNGSWWVRVRDGTGNGVRAYVQCINVPFTSANNAHSLSWSDNQLAASVADAPNRHCWLSKVWGTSGFSGIDAGINTNVILTRNNNEWHLSGHVRNADGDQGFGGAEAVCVDTPFAEVKSHYLTGPVVPGDVGMAIETIPITTTGSACGLTSVRGDWYDWTPFGISDGVYTFNNNPQWTMVATNGRGGTARCIR